MSSSQSSSYTSALSFLNHENYQTYNRDIARLLESVNASIMLSEMVNRFQYHSRMNELINTEKYGPGWFYYTHEKGLERTCLTRKEQDQALNILLKHKLIEKCVVGVPGKRHFRLCENKILVFMGCSNNNSTLSEKDKVDCPKGTKCTYIEEPQQDPQVNTKEKKSKEVIEKPERRPLVHITDEEDHTLLESFEGDRIFLDKCYDHLSKWKLSKTEADPSAVDKHTDYYRILRWVCKAVREEEAKKPIDEAKEWEKTNRDLFFLIKNKYPQELKFVEYTNGFVLNKNNGKDVNVKMNPTSFKQVLQNVIGATFDD